MDKKKETTRLMSTNNSKPTTCSPPAEEIIHPGLCPWSAFLLFFLFISMLVAACSTAPPALTPTPSAPVETGTIEPEQTESPTEGGAINGDDGVSSIQDVATVVSERTPVPTPTPDRIGREVERFATETGLAGSTFLGLKIEVWINLLISGSIIVVGYLIFVKLIRISRRAITRIFPKVDDKFLPLIVKYIDWLLLMYLVRFAVLRLDFLSDNLRTTIHDLYFLIFVGILVTAALDSIRFAAQAYMHHLDPSVDRQRITPIIVIVQRIAQSVALIIGFSIILSHFGFDISIIATILIISGFIISFGAQDILTDVLNGYIILIDQPFRVGDSILVKELDTLGTVYEIGTRSTHIQTGDNRVVTIPNSRIGQSQVVNYTFPDTKFRVQTEIGVAYGTNIQEMREVIEQAVRGVTGVLPDKPVNIYYLKFGGSARLVRVRWWIETYKDEKSILDQVNTALELELDKAGIELPFDTYDLNVKTNE
jgi:small-conductance mechanosensitive channel